MSQKLISLSPAPADVVLVPDRSPSSLIVDSFVLTNPDRLSCELRKSEWITEQHRLTFRPSWAPTRANLRALLGRLVATHHPLQEVEPE